MKLRKRVLFLAHSAQNGGAEFCLDTTLRHLDRETVEPFVIFPTDGPMVASARNMGISVEILPLSWWMLYEPSFWEWKNRLRIPFRLNFLKNFIRKNSIQTVYTNTVCTFEGALAARSLGIPHITHIHEVLEDRFMRPRWFSLPKILKFYYHNSSNIIFESEASRKIAEKQLTPGVKKNVENLLRKSVVISNSSRFSLQDFEFYEKKNPEELASQFVNYGFQKNRVTFLWIGRFSQRKNPFLLVRAVENLPENVRERIQILFVGAGPQEDELKKIIMTKKVENVCRIVPFQENIRPLLRLSDALILTSEEESFGLVLVEAGMFALPVAATRSQGPIEIIEEGKTGFLVPQNDVENLSKVIYNLFSDQELRETLGRQNQQRVLQLFDPVQNTKKIEQLL